MKHDNVAMDKNNSHLGGNLKHLDPETFSENVWNYILDNFKINSMLDVGSGLGFTSKWFKDRGVNVISIEGLPDNVKNSITPTISHDLTLGAYCAEVDLVLCIEVVEHIEEKYLDNLLDTLCCGKYLIMTHAVPGQKGYHHVNCKDSWYWIHHMSQRDYSLDVKSSLDIQKIAKNDNATWIAQNAMVFKK